SLMDNPPTDTPPPLQSLKRNSNDVGWDYEILFNPTNRDKLRCMLCGKEVCDGVYRMKEHIGHVKGNVASCPRSTKVDQEKCKKAPLEGRNKKDLKRKHEEEMRAGDVKRRMTNSIQLLGFESFMTMTLDLKKKMLWTWSLNLMSTKKILCFTRHNFLSMRLTRVFPMSL
ncbi:unnamed protein product, partial [Thlaspi arvense]